MAKPELTEFNAGGTHEQSPIGGIPQGTHPDGTPNSVEEGETKLTVGDQKYVFSNRLNVAQKHIDAKGLPSYVKGKTFAEASKAISKRFKDRIDNASVSTQAAFLDRLVEMQEVVKLEADAKAAGMSVEDFMAAKAQAELEAAEAQVEEQATAQGEAQGEQVVGEQVEQNQFAEGGAIGNAAISGGIDIASGIMADQHSDKEVRDEISVGGNAAKYAAMGAAAGSVVPGIGTAIGAGVGALAGAGSAIASNSKIAGEKQDKFRSDQGQRVLNDGYQAAYGGKQHTMENGGFEPYEPAPFASYLSDNGTDEYDKLQFGTDFGQVGSVSEVDPAEEKDNNALGYAGIGASLAPFIGNLIEGASLEQDDPMRYQRVGRTYRPEFADEQKRLNVVDESFAGSQDAIAAGSAGNLGAYRANILGSNINKSKARQAAFAEINDINRQERKALNADAAMAQREEVEMSNQEMLDERQDKAAYDAAKAAYRTAAYEGLGKIGETIFQTSQQKGLSPYDIFGKRKQDEA